MIGTQANTGVTGALVYQGTWDANLNNPTLSSSTGTKGFFYVVSVNGNTNLDGITDWKVGDWAVFNGSIWEKVDNTDAVTSVNSQIGAVSLGLPQILAVNNATGAFNISVDSGQNIQFGGAGKNISNSGIGWDNSLTISYSATGSSLLLDEIGAVQFISGISTNEWNINALTYTINFQNGTFQSELDFNSAVTASRSWLLPDNSGTIALLSDIPALQNLSSVLTVGNTSGGTDIRMTEGDDVVFLYSTFGNFINTNPLTADRNILFPDNSGTVALLSDIPTNAGDTLYVTDGTLTGNRIVNIGGFGLAFVDQAGTVSLVRIIDSGVGSSYVEIGDNTTTNYPTFQVNGELISQGGVRITDLNGYLIKVQEGTFNLDIDAQTLTANRTQTFQDASGVIALLSDIPTTPNLSSVLAVGNSTGANNIVISASTGVRSIVSDTADAYRLQFGATSISLRKGDFLKGNIDLNANQLNLRYSDTIPNYVNFYMNTPTATTGVFEFSTTMSAGAELRLGTDVAFVLVDNANKLTLTRSVTADRSQAFQDASGTIALLSDIPATPTLSTVLATGNTSGANDIIMSTELGNRIIRSNPNTTANRFEIEFIDSGAMLLRRSSATDTGEVRITTLSTQINFLNNAGQFDTILSVNTNGVSFGTQTASAKTFTLADEYSIVWNEASGSSLGSLNIPAPILTQSRTQSFQDADGVIALLSDIPNISGSGTTNYVTRWTGANTLGTGVIQDNNSTVAINVTPNALFSLYSASTATQQIAVLGSSQSHPTLTRGLQGSASGGSNEVTGVRAEATDGGGGGTVYGIYAFANGLYGGFPTSKSIGAQIHANNVTLGTGDSYGIQVASVGASAGNNIGLFAYASNGGAGSHWAIQIVDGTQGVGKVLTSDANGRANWQTPGGSATWQPPTKDLSAYLGNGASTLANANAGFQKSFGSTANDEVLAEVTLFNNNVNYDGSDLQIRLRWQLFNTAPGVGDDVLWEVDYVFLLDGDDGDSKAATLITDTIDVSGRTANQLYTDVISTNLTGVANAHTLGLTIRRRSSGAGADSYPSAADVFGIELLKV